MSAPFLVWCCNFTITDLHLLCILFLSALYNMYCNPTVSEQGVSECFVAFFALLYYNHHGVLFASWMMDVFLPGLWRSLQWQMQSVSVPGNSGVLWSRAVLPAGEWEKAGDRAGRSGLCSVIRKAMENGNRWIRTDDVRSFPAAMSAGWYKWH